MLSPTEAGAVVSLLQSLGQRLKLDFVVGIVQRDQHCEMFSTSGGPLQRVHVEQLKDLITAAIAKQGIPVVNEDNTTGEQN